MKKNLNRKKLSFFNIRNLYYFIILLFISSTILIIIFHKSFFIKFAIRTNKFQLLHMNTIGDKIKELRSLMGYSLQDLASMVNVSKAAIQQYENDLLDHKAKFQDQSCRGRYLPLLV